MLGSAFEAGKVIWQQGAPRHLVSVVRGLVKLSTMTEDGQEVTLFIAGPGDVLGLPRETYQVSALRDTILKLADVPAGEVHRYTESRLDNMTQRLTDRQTLPVEKRLAKILVELSISLGMTVIPVPQHVLAQMVGANNCTINRTLGHWCDAGIIRLVPAKNRGCKGCHRVVEILNQPALREHEPCLTTVQ